MSTRNADYRIVLDPLAEEDGGGWLAVVPDLPGCKSDGETPEEALENVRDAISCWIAAAHRLGRDIPRPSRLMVESTRSVVSP